MPSAKSTARAGAAAFALGLSLAGPQALGVALADTTDASSSVTSSSSPASRERSAAVRKPVRRATRSAAAAGPAASTGETRRPAASRTAASVPPGHLRTPNTKTRPAPAARGTSRRVIDTQTSAADPQTAAPADEAPVADTSDSTTQTAAAASVASLSTADTEIARPAAVASVAGLLTAGPPANSAAAAGNAMASLLGFQSIFSGFGLFIRRNFFNQAPTVNPVQLTGQSGGLITGSVGAVDPEQEQVSYSLTQAPKYGSVVIASDGTFTYTPGANFTGIDSFNVAASDGGRHLNLFNLRRPASTEAFIQVTQGSGQAMVTFNFIYGSGSQFWSSEARNALQTAANTLSSYIVVSTPVTLTYDVTGNKSLFSSTLATAGSDLVSDGSGFFNTVVQQKVLTGVDPNGSSADGQIDWNFGQPWAFGSSVGNNQYDFTSTALHELVHTLGFLSNIDAPGSNNGRNWTTFDSFVVTANGSDPIRNDFSWNTAFNSYLTSGMYFAGPNAVAVYGGPVPLYTPSPWQSGSSMSHLSDSSFYGNNDKLMNAQVSLGPSLRTLSTLELAVLKDLGYTVNSQAVYVLLLGIGLLRRRKAESR
ncbi:MAG: cadherin-like domain-containing protein [Mycobacterium sp.]|nr:cadherin-like domain-containing protein [Mycobacterium sp.]